MSLEEKMALALEAARAAAPGEVPVGAVVFRGDRLLASASNRRESSGDPTAHAELLVLRQAAALLGGWNLEGCDLFVTLEPCMMCAGAILQSHLSRVFFGAFDPRAGCCGSVMNPAEDGRLPSCTRVYGGLLAEDCAALLRDFFAALRAGDKTAPP